MLILCLAWRDKGKCLVAKLKSSLATKLNKDFYKSEIICYYGRRWITLEAYKVKVDYSKFFAKLKSENIKQKEFRDKAKISGVTMQKMLHNESVTIDSICKVCDYFRCMPDEIMEFIPEENYPEDIKAKQQAKQEVQAQIAELQAKLKQM